MWLIGVMVLMLHDISDFALINVRAYRVILSLCRISNIAKNGFWTVWILCPCLYGWAAEYLFLDIVVCFPVWRRCLIFTCLICW